MPQNHSLSGAPVRPVRGRACEVPRRRAGNRARAPLCLALALLLASPPAPARAATWNGTADNSYNNNGNWSFGDAPDIAGEFATFSGLGPAAITVTGTVSPDSWTFANPSQAYVITGGTAAFGTAAGLADNAVGQTISIDTGLSGIGGLSMTDASGTLTLTGANSYSGATTISAGTLQIGNGGTA